MVVVCNFAPVTREKYIVGVPDATSYDEIFNSDDVRFGGSGVVNKGAIRVKKVPDHDMAQSIELTLPPLAVVFLKGRKRKPKAAKVSKTAKAKPAKKATAAAKAGKPASKAPKPRAPKKG